jgi:hypothetical protein
MTGACVIAQEFYEVAAAVAILDQGIDLAGEQVDAGRPQGRARRVVEAAADLGLKPSAA